MKSNKISKLILTLFAIAISLSLFFGNSVSAEVSTTPVTPPTAPISDTPTVTPTTIVIPTATATPTVIPTSTPKPTVTPLPVTAPISVTPIPTPVQNKKPVISTLILPVGRLNKQYKTTIEGYDQNKNDNLVMAINDLPKGLSMTGCKQKIKDNKKTIECEIKGTSSKRGVYLIKTKLSDNNSASVSKSIPLIII